MGLIQNFLLGVRKREKWYHKLLYDMVISLRNIRMPFPKFLGAIFFNERNMRITAWRRIKQFFYYEPMFRYRCKRVGKGLYFESNFPLILGYGSVYVGDRVRISGNVNFIVSYKANPDPIIEVGDDVYLGYATVLSSAERIKIGNRVLIAAGVQIYDNNNHPIDPAARSRNEPIGPKDVSPVIIEDEVWLGAGVTIMKGVTIGKGSVVAAGAVVTKAVPPMSIVAGNPAVVVKQIQSIQADKKTTSDGETIEINDR